MNIQSKIFSHSIRFLLLFIFVSFSCTPNISKSTKTIGSQINIMNGNTIKTDNYSKLSLNAGMTSSENRDLYFLKLDYSHPEFVPHIYPGDKLILTIDDIDLELNAFYVEPSKDHVISYYYIDKLDLIDLGNAKEARLKAYGGNDHIEAEFSTENIHMIREYINSHVFQDVEISEDDLPRNWGFLGVGGGTSHIVWLGSFSRQFTLEDFPELLNFGSLGLGYTEFDYERIRYNNQQYVTDFNEQIWIFGAIYGLSYPVNWIRSWTLEIGFLFQYYYYNDERYKNLVRDSKNFPTISYRNVKGKSYSGPTIGFFIQAGSFWYSINTFGYWNLGVSIPIK
jgi:hypothetical protein